MKTTVFLLAYPEIFKDLTKDIQELGYTVERNFEQVQGLCKTGELEKLFIFMDADNVSSEKYNVARGQTVAEKIHKIDPSIKILIWDGRKILNGNQKIPDSFNVEGIQKPIEFKNELYISCSKDISIIEIASKFINNTLERKDLLEYECLERFF